MPQVADTLRKRTFEYGLRIIGFCRKLPDNWIAREVGKQLLRAGMGVPGNYWSACRGRSDKEFIARIGIAADEADESVLWLNATTLSGTRMDAEAKDLVIEGSELRAILAKSHKTAKDNRKRRKANEKPTKSARPN